jgi:hypothetical protein
MAMLRAFLVVVAYENLDYRQYNIKNTFIESNLKEELWIKIP